MTYKFKLDALSCPKCIKEDLGLDSEIGLVCESCSTVYPIRNGIPILLVDPSSRTQLEHVDYDAMHNVSSKTSERLYQGWAEVFQMYNLNYNNIVELGSGTGMLTYGLALKSPFDNIFVSDISYYFLKMNFDSLPVSEKNMYFCVCDANYLPFKNSYFDVVVGNSVLHHFLDYETTLRRSFNILNSEGIAVFTEPVREGHVIIALLNALMREIHCRTDLKVFDEKELRILEQMSRHVTKHLRLKGDLKRIAKLEDKYIFSIQEMKDLGKNIGYKDVQFFNMGIPAGSKPAWGYKPYVKGIMTRHGIPEEKIDRFDFLFSCFGQTFSDAIGDQLVTPFGFFVFEK